MKLTDLDILSFGNTIQMVGVIYSGEGTTFLCRFPGHENKHDVEDLEMNLEDWKKVLRQTDLKEVEVLAQAKDKKMVKAIIRKCQRQIDQRVTWAVFRRDYYACRYCGVANMPLTVDHLVTWEDGGPSIEENLVASCRDCNKTRGNQTYYSWLNDTYYWKVSKALTQVQRAENAALAGTLEDIPRRVHIKSR